MLVCFTNLQYFTQIQFLIQQQQMQRKRQRQRVLEEGIIWQPSTLTIQLTIFNENHQYILLTNSLQLHQAEKTFASGKGKKQQDKNKVIFKLKHSHLKTSEKEEELDFFKFCFVMIDKESGQFADLLYPKTFNILLPIIKKIITPSKISKKTEERQPALRRFASLNDLSKAIVERQISPQTRSIASISSLIQQERIEYFIFVTKNQALVKNNNQNKSPQSLSWSEKQLQFISDQIKFLYGQFTNMIAKRQYAKFIFSKSKNDNSFSEIWKEINRELLFKPFTIAQQNIDFYIISKKPLLNQEQRTSKLFMLSNDEAIIDFALNHPWIIVGTQHCVLFIHSEKPMDYFKHEKALIPTKILVNPNKQKSVIIIDKRRTIFLYHLGSKNPTLQAVFHVPFLIPYTILPSKTHMVLGGIDLQEIKGGFSQKHKSFLRSLFIINHSFSTLKKQMINYEKRLQVLKVGSEGKDMVIPLMNLVKTKEDNVVGCSWNQRFYLISLKGYKLLQVELKQPIRNLLEIQYAFNILNFMLLLINGDLVRVGVESWGKNLGAELNLSKTNKIGCLNNAATSNQLFVGVGSSLLILNYLKDESQVFRKEEEGRWERVCADSQGMTFILNFGHYLQIKYIEN